MFNLLLKIPLPIGRTVRDSTTQLGSLQNPLFFRFISSKSPRDQIQNDFVVSYLISSCGFSPTAAISASRKISFLTAARPDTNLTLFRNHGFTEKQISMLIRKCPALLVAKPTETLLPKLEYFYSVGVQNSDLAKILSRDPGVLFSSLENQIIPSFIFFKSLVGTVENVVIALKRQTRFLKCNMQNLAQNVATLRENGVPESNILTLLTYYPKTVTPKNDRFKQRVGEIKQMGFDPSRSPFVIALVGFSSMNKSTWKQKLEAFGSWGLSEDDTVSAFKKYPWCMMLSEKKIRAQMDFFLNKMGWELADVTRSPQILGFSLEKRLIPRCSVLRVLQLKGLVERDHSIGSVLIKSDKSFMEKFVTKYEKEVPQLLDVYKGKIGLPELGYGSDEVSRRKLIVKILNF
ncbi:uncharacterized protein LOC122074031 [Macadamia integrifolia]|uniref:uncharacterized protein LOC122074031 n=1 Tax=Macadamia integrifolia TaxID=60698 RepID=UPI001C50265C|nr:uncharacterized protein LOC122074031 [Macadamia integrifolia]